MTSPSQPEASALDALLDRYPQLNAPQVSRRALLAVGSLLALDLTGCGSSDDDSVASSGGSGNTTPVPTLTAFTPSSGSTAGGTLVTITGTNLTGASTVMFGGTAASSFTVVSSTQITATAPAHAAGVVTPSIITPGGTAVATANFTYVQPYINGGVVSTLAGSTTSGSANGTGTAARFFLPNGVAVDSNGNVYVADTYNNMVRKIVVSTSAVTTLAGSGSYTPVVNGTGTAATFYQPGGIAVDSIGNVYVVDGGNNLIRKIVLSTGAVTTLAGDGLGNANNGTGTGASFAAPLGIAADTSGNVYVADSYNNLIRKIVVSTGVVTTLAGRGPSNAGFTDSTGTAASFDNPSGVAVDSSGNVYVADSNNNAIRKIVVSTGVVTTLAGQGPNNGGFTNGTGTAASFNSPTGVAVDSNGNVYVADSNNSLIRKITSSGVVTTLAGGAFGSATNGTGTGASFSNPFGIAVDSSGNVYVADTGNNMIRKIS